MEIAGHRVTFESSVEPSTLSGVRLGVQMQHSAAAAWEANMIDGNNYSKSDQVSATHTHTHAHTHTQRKPY